MQPAGLDHWWVHRGWDGMGRVTGGAHDTRTQQSLCDWGDLSLQDLGSVNPAFVCCWGPLGWRSSPVDLTHWVGSGVWTGSDGWTGFPLRLVGCPFVRSHAHEGTGKDALTGRAGRTREGGSARPREATPPLPPMMKRMGGHCHLGRGASHDKRGWPGA